MTVHPLNAKRFERLRFIDFVLEHFGVIQRGHLMDYFGISLPQASHDFAHYQDIAPGNMEYDVSARTYKKTAAFVRQMP